MTKNVKNLKIKKPKQRNKSIEIVFNPKIYPLNILKQAISDFKTAADISLKIKKTEIIANIKPKEKIKNIKWEFSNYALALKMNQV
jgi:hypothetical protein